MKRDFAIFASTRSEKKEQILVSFNFLTIRSKSTNSSWASLQVSSRLVLLETIKGFKKSKNTRTKSLILIN